MDPASVEIPPRDQRQLALALKPGVAEIPEVVNATPPSYEVGETAEFWVSNSDTQEHFKVTAELRHITPHLYMWVQEGVRINQSDLEASAERFETATYPTNREFFGSEWTPGVDNDPHLSVLHARGLGQNVAGYYSSADEFSRLVNPYSNEREMFYISADVGSARPNTSFYDGTLAHEFQHMIHWANDRNEDSWVNEGMSELAGFLNGFDPGGADIAYSQQPDTQLNAWADPSEGNIEHYGASYLFTTYFLDRFGEGLTKAVVNSSRNGIAGYNEALEQAGQPERFDESSRMGRRELPGSSECADGRLWLQGLTRLVRSSSKRTGSSRQKARRRSSSTALTTSSYARVVTTLLTSRDRPKTSS
jgi:hypothetical protein